MKIPEEFINPKSMMTPGIAGGIVTLISNTLWFHFELPAKWVALFLSVLIGVLIIRELVEKIPLKLLYLILNSLIIFSVSMGANTAGKNIEKNSKDKMSGMIKLVVSNAYAGAEESECDSYIDEIVELKEKNKRTVSMLENFQAAYSEKSIENNSHKLVATENNYLKSELHETINKLNIAEKNIITLQDNILISNQAYVKSSSESRSFFHEW